MILTQGVLKLNYFYNKVICSAVYVSLCYTLNMDTIISKEQQELKALAVELGADLIGFSTSETVPTAIAPNLKNAVSIALKYTDSVLETIDEAPSYVYFHAYRTLNTYLDNIAYRIARAIEKMGYNALPVAASQSQGKGNPYNGVVPHKTYAVKSGLGYVGKSGLFISREYGSKVRLATILTDMPLVRELPIIENGCGNCELCVKACPAGALYGELPTTDGERNFSAEKCSQYMKKHFQDIGRGSVCGICIKVCPKNKLK